jgi:hypothetical protein
VVILSYGIPDPEFSVIFHPIPSRYFFPVFFAYWMLTHVL